MCDRRTVRNVGYLSNGDRTTGRPIVVVLALCVARELRPQTNKLNGDRLFFFFVFFFVVFFLPRSSSSPSIVESGPSTSERFNCTYHSAKLLSPRPLSDLRSQCEEPVLNLTACVKNACERALYAPGNFDKKKHIWSKKNQNYY